MEALPAYTCTMTSTARFLYKAELEDPFRPARVRRWSRVEAELRGTLLLLYEGDPSSPFTHVRSFGLLSADVGLATDYTRRKNVLRLRAEGYQFLLAAADPWTVLRWVDMLDAAVTLSTPLDDRREPKAFFVPSLTLTVTNAKLADRLKRNYRDSRYGPRRDRSWLYEQPGTLQPSARQSVPSLERGRGSYHSRNEGDADAEGLSVHATLTRTDSQRCCCPCTQCWRGSLDHTWTALSISTSSFSSVDTMMDRGDEMHASVGLDNLTDIKRTSNRTSLSCAQDLNYATRCTRVLLYTSRWRYGCYYRAGRRIQLPKPSKRLGCGALL